MEKAHCVRALKSSTLSTTPRRELRMGVVLAVYVHVGLSTHPLSAQRTDGIL